MGLLRITVAPEHAQNEVIEWLSLENTSLENATWVKGHTWRGKLTLFTLVEDGKALDLMITLNEVFNAKLIDGCALEWGRRNRFKLRRIYGWRLPW